MRSRMFVSGVVAVSSIAALGLIGGSALAVEVPPADAVTGETETAAQTEGSGEPDPVDVALDEVDETVETTAETISDTGSSAPEPVSSTADGAADTLTDTSQGITDAVRQAVGTSDGSPDPEPGAGGDGGTQGAGGGTVPAPSPSSTSVMGGSLLAGAPARVPNRVALDGFRRTSGDSDRGPAFPVVDDPVLEPEPSFAPPTTRQVVEPVAAGPQLPLRAVAIEVLVAAGLLVLATGGLVAELGPERV